MSEGGDIGFRVYCKSSDEDLVPLVRIESNLVAEDGHAVCEQVGECKYLECLKPLSTSQSRFLCRCREV